MPGNKTYAIHPAIGIARVGNAKADPKDPSTYYLCPESPYQVPDESQTYKSDGKIKKQAQRFRIYEFEDGKATREITCDQSDVKNITWTVHVANRKSALDVSGNGGSVSTPGVPPASYGPAKTRNAGVTDREQLSIDPGPQSVSGDGAQQTLTGSITFESVSKEVALGHLYVEPGSGRLLYFASDGDSQGLKDGKWGYSAELKTYANNDNWYDEIADGRVQAEINFTDGTTCKLNDPEQAAWVIGTVPRFVPGIFMYTTIYEVAIDAILGTSNVPKPSFARDIYPILASASLLPWVNARSAAGHGPSRPGYYLAATRLQTMADNNPDKDSDAYKARDGVFKRIRNPADPALNNKLMPQLPMQLVEEPNKEDWDVATVTARQYAMLEMWRDGNFEPGTEDLASYTPLDQLDVSEQPAALDHAALQTTSGTPCFPGIESWRITRDPELYLSAMPIRISGQALPGDLSIGNALPWQADYLDCIDAWWPIQRPNQVTRNGASMQQWVPKQWEDNSGKGGYNKMAESWWKLGFVVSEENGSRYVEVEQEPLE